MILITQKIVEATRFCIKDSNPEISMQPIDQYTADTLGKIAETFQENITLTHIIFVTIHSYLLNLEKMVSLEKELYSKDIKIIKKL